MIRPRPLAAALILLAAAARAAEPSAPVPEAARPGAAVDRKAFRFHRTIAAAPAGLVELQLDAEVLARSPMLADLRIVGDDDRQLPYLLDRSEAAMPAALAEVPRPSRDAVPPELGGPGLTLHALGAPAAPLPPARLELETGARVFTRRVRVWARPAGPAASASGGGAVLADAVWAHADPDRPAAPLSLDLPGLADARILVAVGDGDNAPLPLTAARLLLPSYRLRFFHPGAPLTLRYGADLPAPEYDLALLAPRLRAAPARAVALGPAAEAPDAASAARSACSGGRVAFWIVLGLAVIGLLAVVGRLLARAENAPP